MSQIAQALLRYFYGGQFRESLEGDLLEELASGRSKYWYWRQVGWALIERAFSVARQQAVPFLVAILFFLVALWVIAPASYPVMVWASSLESLRIIVLLGWLAGVPLVLGALAGAMNHRRRFGAILLGAGFIYFSPVTQPFSFAACDLCQMSSTTIPDTVRLLTPLGSSLLAGLGAWAVGQFRLAPYQGRYS